jgi:hypothetical protein
LDPERGARRRKNNEIKIGNQLHMVVVPVLSLHAATRGVARARTTGCGHAALGRISDAPPGGRSSIAAT